LENKKERKCEKKKEGKGKNIKKNYLVSKFFFLKKIFSSSLAFFLTHTMVRKIHTHLKALLL